jgi:primosomal protein N' (replication factor Y)
VSVFGEDRIALYHSKQTPSQQRKNWFKILNAQEPLIVIGPRSAIFLPHKNLASVILDEAHDNSYKQDSGSRYSGVMAAGSLAKIHAAQLILGSATPPVQETQQVLSKGGLLVCMHSLAKNKRPSTKKFEIVDMTEQKNKSAVPLLSKKMIDSIKIALSRKEQILLFLNKRGTARVLLCEKCGWHSECPRCEMPLTHHHDSFTLQCHLCGYRRKSILICPECNSTVSLKSPGIKAVEQDISKLFPGAKIARFDSDNLSNDTFHKNYESIRNGDVDIIIGTQIVTKGMDLPLLSVVGILQADSSLFLPDYTSEENAFQQLTQVSGRVGRGHGNGNVIAQTYQPESYIFPFVARQDWHGFYEQELEKRQQSGYPPASYGMKIWVSKLKKEAASKALEDMLKKLDLDSSIKVLGPAPCFYEKASGMFSWQVILLSKSRNQLSEMAKKIGGDFYYDLDPTSFL